MYHRNIFGSSLKVFGNLRKSSDIFGNFGKLTENVREPSSGLRNNFGKSSESGRKSSENMKVVGNLRKTWRSVSLYNKQNNTWTLGDMEFIFSCSHSISHSFAVLTRSILMWTLEDKFHISARPCIIFYLSRIFSPPPPPPPPPDISPSFYRPTKNPLRSCISPELITGILQYLALPVISYLKKNSINLVGKGSCELPSGIFLHVVLSSLRITHWRRRLGSLTFLEARHDGHVIVNKTEKIVDSRQLVIRITDGNCLILGSQPLWEALFHRIMSQYWDRHIIEWRTHTIRLQPGVRLFFHFFLAILTASRASRLHASDES